VHSERWQLALLGQRDRAAVGLQIFRADIEEGVGGVTGRRSPSPTVAGKPRAWKWSTGARSWTVRESRDFDEASSAETIRV